MARPWQRPTMHAIRTGGNPDASGPTHGAHGTHGPGSQGLGTHPGTRTGRDDTPERRSACPSVTTKAVRSSRPPHQAALGRPCDIACVSAPTSEGGHGRPSTEQHHTAHAGQGVRDLDGLLGEGAAHDDRMCGAQLADGALDPRDERRLVRPRTHGLDIALPVSLSGRSLARKRHTSPERRQHQHEDARKHHRARTSSSHIAHRRFALIRITQPAHLSPTPRAGWIPS